uniref:D-isomer specific 2-hydroxyacid dehydrogenase NAD-binding domain-containing protein n=1 Tax=Zea mays TaxID=4577 RepID=A0A804QKR0_MAIZE
MCAGITIYTPMIRHNMNQPSKSLGVIGLGGLGHMAFKFGKAFGLKVTVFRRVNRREFKPLISSAQIILSYHLMRNRWRRLRTLLGYSTTMQCEGKYHQG